MLRAFAGKLRSWALADRVRAPPAEGRLLRVPVGGCLRIGGVVVRVVGRTACEAEVVYDCRGADRDVRVGVAVTPDGLPRVRLLDVLGERPLPGEDVEAFA